ncbi:unnamed protein product, partial [Vitis vinifera]
MNGAVLVAITAAIGNLLQGWDNATIAGAVLYIKREFHLQTEPTIEGLIVAMSLIGATAITTFSGPVADWLGRRPMLIISSVLYFLSGLVMLWSPNVYVLLLARLLDGFGIGLAVTLVPVYISETAPSEIRGLLNTLPQFTGSGGMFLSYCMVFWMSLMDSPKWRLMLGVLSIPSLLYFALTVFYLPESPRWLVSKGRMAEAKQVLQRLRGREDVAGEMALLVEGLGVGGDTSIEEYMIGPADELADNQEQSTEKDQINVPLMDPLVTLFGSVHEKFPETGSMRSMLFPNMGSMFSVAEYQDKNEQWDEESLQRDGEDYGSDGGGESDDNLRSPLLSPAGEAGSSMGIGGEGGFVQASALVSQSMLYSKGGKDKHPIGPAMVQPAESVAVGPSWQDLFEPGIKRALFVGVGIQILQQFSGINGVLYYTPQILEQAGVGVLLSNMGIGSESASLLISGLTTLLMLPSIGFAMRLMDVSGRRWLLLTTLPILLLSLIILVLGNIIPMGSLVHAIISTVSVVVYFCCFVMAFGPIPNILCSEIFPTRVRGLCIAVCALTFWICDIIVTYSLPVMLSSVGLAGVFGIYAIVCILSWIFVFLKVPETKGMPLEVISEFFAVGAKQAATDAKNN